MVGCDWSSSHSHTAYVHTKFIYVYFLVRGILKETMSLASPSTQSIQAFVFGLDNDSGSHKRATPSDLVDEDVNLEGNEKRQSMYVELLDGTYPVLRRAKNKDCIDGLSRDVGFRTQI